ncbi:hypothetical protein [Nocardioides sp. zg-DK7169]|uniref:hypothetical protein n=1 Tax=Nocardioides sp. zg-DK7169 TaxID=2736600 RepID=UPI001556D9D9|nr:hypothetical protein [Nocardioides sp. zg-DK7169]NPC98746.1 hypothetical protein [Nocardioides sp. zg-DK7169]
MKPLQATGCGLLLILLNVTLGGFDLLPDLIGWALVLLGVVAMRARLPTATPVLAAAATAGVVSVPLWLPGVAESVADADPALAWALSLPQVVFAVLFFRALEQLAQDAGNHDAAGWLRICWVGAVIVGVLPAVLLPFAASGPLVGLAGVFSLLVGVLQVVLCFAYAGRSWARRAGAPATR